MTPTETDPEAVRRGRRQLLGLAALFFVPLAVAFWLYYGPADWRPAGDSHKGDLIDPALSTHKGSAKLAAARTSVTFSICPGRCPRFRFRPPTACLPRPDSCVANGRCCTSATGSATSAAARRST